jgi:DNA modification methylase
MQIEIAPVGKLQPYGQNARTHSRAQIKQIAASIKKFGFCNPVLVDDDNRITAGHGRVEAAKTLGLAAVPTVRLSHLSAAEKRAYVLADNRLAEKAGWDREILAIELQALSDEDFEVDVTGFSVGEVDIILDEAAQAKSDAAAGEDNLPEPDTDDPVTQLGDLWILGNHRLVCGDARDEAAYGQLLGDDKAQLVCTDPPYNVPIDGHVCGRGQVHHRDFANAAGEMSPADFTAFLTQVFERLGAHSQNGSIHAICMDWRHLAEMMAAGNQVYAELKNVCVWVKNNWGMGTFYRSQHELIFMWKLGDAPHVNNFELGQHGRTRSNVWRYDGMNTFKPGRMDELALHPTVKPVALVADAMKDCSRWGGLVLDPFCGSGTILVAAQRTGRKARALEIDPVYVDVAVRRWQAYTGKSAVLAATGETFEQVVERRTATLSAA